MSTLWTPGGERPIRKPAPAEPAPPREGRPRAAPPHGGPAESELTADEREALAAQLAQAQERILSAPPENIVANHCYGLFELAAMYLSARPPHLDGARLAIDAVDLLIEGLADRLGPAKTDMAEGLAQLKMAYVQIQSAPPGPDSPPV